jgi:hypothetical protein
VYVSIKWDRESTVNGANDWGTKTHSHYRNDRLSTVAAHCSCIPTLSISSSDSVYTSPIHRSSSRSILTYTHRNRWSFGRNILCVRAVVLGWVGGVACKKLLVAVAPFERYWASVFAVPNVPGGRGFSRVAGCWMASDGRERRSSHTFVIS